MSKSAKPNIHSSVRIFMWHRYVPLQGTDLDIRCSGKEVKPESRAQTHGTSETNDEGISGWVAQPIVLPVLSPHGRRLELSLGEVTRRVECNEL
jgi:hypothetical protein